MFFFALLAQLLLFLLHARIRFVLLWFCCYLKKDGKNDVDDKDDEEEEEPHF